jgi:hypothetical protein
MKRQNLKKVTVGRLVVYMSDIVIFFGVVQNTARKMYNNFKKDAGVVGKYLSAQSFSKVSGLPIDEVIAKLREIDEAKARASANTPS